VLARFELIMHCIALALVSAHLLFASGHLLLSDAQDEVRLTPTDRELLLGYACNASCNTSTRKAMESVYDAYARDWDQANLDRSMSKAFRVFKSGVQNRKHRKGGTYRYISAGPHCDIGPTDPKVVRPAGRTSGVHPGGILSGVSGFSFSRFMNSLTGAATGPSSGAGKAAGIGSQAVSMGAGMIQGLASSILYVVPPMIPPHYKPLPCLPMITGHNCFGAILHRITLSDFMIADVTDSMVTGHIASFPAVYAARVGKTSDALYKTCYGAYMSMMCSSIFPRCTTPQSSSDVMPAGGRVPMCFFLCISTLVACPGSWIQGPCSLISVPPMCTVAFYWRVGTAPPQYEDFSGANGYPADCPPSAEMEPEEAEAPPPSPIERAAAAVAVRLPDVK